MKANSPRFIIAFICFVACAHKTSTSNTISNENVAVTDNVIVADSFVTGKVIPAVICKTDASQSYALYIPSTPNGQPLTVIYFFDPHADGELPVNKYKALADKYNFILVGSNNSKNGNDYNVAENIYQNIFNDTQQRLHINANRIYTCGFSGGAKVASYLALHHNEIKGVIVGGAGLPDETQPGNFNFSFTAIAGEGDMNMTDLVAINNELDKTQTVHRIIFFDGKHEWCNEATMNVAIAALQLDAMRSKLIVKDDSFINEFATKSKQTVTEEIAANKLIRAEEDCKLSLNLLNGLSADTTWFKQKDISVLNSSAYEKQEATQQNLFTQEQSMKAVYQQQFQQGDINYWTKTINDLQTKSKGTTAEAAMYQRLLAYLSLAFYSITNQLIQNNQNATAQYFDQLYKLADSTNSEAWYFSAIINARNNNAKATQDDLMKAADNGFNDEARMLQQPEFEKLANQINFSAVIAKMKTIKK